MNEQPTVPTADILAEAKRYPNGWVYVLDGTFGPNEAVPLRSIIGAWEVNSNGDLTGTYWANPEHRPRNGDAPKDQ